MRDFVSCGAFSLTLTLSRWEREQPLVNFFEFICLPAEAVFCFAMNQRREFVKRLEAILPLPAGEGRGEGETCGKNCIV